MKKLLGILLLTCFILVPSVNATTLGFDGLAAGSYASIVYSDVTITDLNGGNVNVLASGSGGTGYASAFNNIAANAWTVGEGLLFTFTSLVNNISLVGGDGGGDTDSWTMEAFDSSWTSLGLADTGAYTGADPVNPIPGTTYGDYRTLALNVSGIQYLKVIQTRWGSGFDDLTFDTGAPVPEPATMFLFGIGLLGLAGVNRKKQ